MALQKINWTQIDSSNVPAGSYVYVGSMATPVDGVYTKRLFIGEEGQQNILHDFFEYLEDYTGSTYFASLLYPNTFNADQTINGSVYVLSVSGVTDGTASDTGSGSFSVDMNALISGTRTGWISVTSSSPAQTLELWQGTCP